MDILNPIVELNESENELYNNMISKRRKYKQMTEILEKQIKILKKINISSIEIEENIEKARNIRANVKLFINSDNYIKVQVERLSKEISEEFKVHDMIKFSKQINYEGSIVNIQFINLWNKSILSYEEQFNKLIDTHEKLRVLMRTRQQMLLRRHKGITKPFAESVENYVDNFKSINKKQKN